MVRHGDVREILAHNRDPSWPMWLLEVVLFRV
jgi:hypothetical protein